MATLRARMDRAASPVRHDPHRRWSNNWVVDAAHSTAGKAIVSNDPHLSAGSTRRWGTLSAMTASDGSG